MIKDGQLMKLQAIFYFFIFSPKSLHLIKIKTKQKCIIWKTFQDLVFYRIDNLWHRRQDFSSYLFSFSKKFTLNKNKTKMYCLHNNQRSSLLSYWLTELDLQNVIKLLTELDQI